MVRMILIVAGCGLIAGGGVVVWASFNGSGGRDPMMLIYAVGLAAGVAIPGALLAAAGFALGHLQEIERLLRIMAGQRTAGENTATGRGGARTDARPPAPKSALDSDTWR